MRWLTHSPQRCNDGSSYLSYNTLFEDEILINFPCAYLDCSALGLKKSAAARAQGHTISPHLVITSHRHNLAQTPASENAIKMKLKRMYNHPNYLPMTVNRTNVPPLNDIALWHVTGGDVSVQQYGYMSFDDSLFTSGKQKAIATGWGLTRFDSYDPSDVLKQVALPYVKEANCKRMLTIPSNVRLTDICAGGVDGESSCNGDSGSPLFLTLPDGRLDIVGVTSAGAKCGTKNMPGLYTRVSLYKDWITKTISDINQQS